MPTVTSVGQVAGLKTFYAADQSHVVGPVVYPESPPVRGEHDPEWAGRTGTVYAGPIRNENAVRSLEHGATWITHDLDVSSPPVWSRPGVSYVGHRPDALHLSGAGGADQPAVVEPPHVPPVCR